MTIGMNEGMSRLVAVVVTAATAGAVAAIIAAAAPGTRAAVATAASVTVENNWPPGSGYVIQDYGSADPDPKEIFPDPKHKK
jgi:hypothetical protein